jgi:hypothetical protein
MQMNSVEARQVEWCALWIGGIRRLFPIRCHRSWIGVRGL